MIQLKFLHKLPNVHLCLWCYAYPSVASMVAKVVWFSVVGGVCSLYYP